MHDLKKTIRAVLFASAQKLELEKIAKICKTSEEEALKELEDWKKELDKTNDPMKLIQEGNTWRLTIREKFIPAVRKIVKKTEIPKSILETLSVVAYKAPVLQSEVIKIRTNKAYDHLTYLEKTGFLTREKHGRTKMLKLTPKFYEYFDISPEKLKAKMNEKIPLQTFETVEVVEEPKKELQTYTEKLGELEVYEEKQETEEEQKKEEAKQKEEEKDTSEEAKKEKETEAKKRETKQNKEKDLEEKKEAKKDITEETKEVNKTEKELERAEKEEAKIEKKEAIKDVIEETKETTKTEKTTEKTAEEENKTEEQKEQKPEKKAEPREWKGKGLYPKGIPPDIEKRVEERVQEIITGKRKENQDKEEKEEQNL